MYWKAVPGRGYVHCRCAVNQLGLPWHVLQSHRTRCHQWRNLVTTSSAPGAKMTCGAPLCLRPAIYIQLVLFTE